MHRHAPSLRDGTARHSGAGRWQFNASGCIVKLDSSGGHVWSYVFGDANTGLDEAKGVAVNGTGASFVVGNFTNHVDFGNGPLTSSGGTDVYVAKLPP